MSESDSDRAVGAVLFSEKLLGLRDECPACGEWQSSTGWLLSRKGDADRWYIDFQCEGCRSRGGTWNRQWLPLMEEVIKAAIEAN